MFQKKSIYSLGVLFLLVGLLWLYSGHLIHALPSENHMDKEMNHEDSMDHSNHDMNLGLSLLGVIPTLIGFYLIDKHNRSLGRH